jgi:hypothetical protein
MVGPVASAYEHTGPLAARLTDAAARELPTAERVAPWAASYTASPVGEPPLFISEVWTDSASLKPGVFPPVRLRVGSTRQLGPVTIEILDHHRVPVASRTRVVGPEATTFTYPPQKVSPGNELPDIEGVHIKVGAFERVVTVGVTAMGPDPISVGLGGMKPPADAP